jgi:hypothetical protein
MLANGPAALRPVADEVGGAVASGSPQTALALAPDGTERFVAAAARDAFVSGLNDILLVGAAIALVGAALSFVLVRTSDFVHEDVGESYEAVDRLAA